MSFGHSLSPFAHLQVINLFNITYGVWVCCLPWLRQVEKRLSLRSCGCIGNQHMGTCLTSAILQCFQTVGAYFLPISYASWKQIGLDSVLNIPCSRTQADKDSTQFIFHNHCHRRYFSVSTRQLNISTQGCHTSLHPNPVGQSKSITMLKFKKVEKCHPTKCLEWQRTKMTVVVSSD